MKYEEVMVYLGLILLLIALTTYALFSYIVLSYRNIPDNMVTWFHLHVINYLRVGGDPSRDFSLRYIDGRDLWASPILIDYVFASLNIDPGLWTLVTGLFYIALVFIVTYIFSKNPLIAGFASLLFSVIPCFNYWFKYNVYGPYTLQFLWLFLIMLLSKGLVEGKRSYLVVFSIVNPLTWLMWSEAWFILLLYSIYVSALLYRGIFSEKHLYMGVIILLTTLPLNIILGIKYITVYHVYAYIVLLLNVLIGFLVLKTRELISEHGFLALRIVSVTTSYPIAYYVIALINRYVVFPGFLEDYSKIYNPLLDYGIVGLFTLLALIMVIRSRILQDIGSRMMEFMLISGFIVAVVLAYGLHVLSVIAVSAITPFIAFAVITVVSSLYRLSSGRLRIIYVVVSLWIVIGGITANAIPAYTVSSAPPDINYMDVPREILIKVHVNESSLLKVLDSIKGNITREALFISYWGYSYWITGYLGAYARTLADPHGSIEGQRLVSWIMLSDEETAYSLIKNLIGNKSAIDVYIVVSEVVSIDLKQTTSRVKLADLGAVLILPPRTPDERPERSYRAFGDLDRIFVYVEHGGFNVSKYIDTMKAKYYHEASLSWSGQMLNTLLVKLIVNGLKSMGYDVVNDIYSEFPLRVEKPKYFRLVSASLTPLQRVTRDIYDYQVYMYTAIYKVEL